ncbi:MAG: hypothetical protein ACOY5W_09175 [Pseudomonadota bacterium]
MSFLQQQQGATGVIVPVYLQDANGNGVAGITAAQVTARYKREGATMQSMTAVAATEGTWQTRGWAESAGMGAGNYEFHLPDAMIAAGAGWVVLEIGATGARTERYLIELGPFEVALPDNFGDLAITQTTGLVSVGTNNDKSGYVLDADQSHVVVGEVSAVQTRVTANVDQIAGSATAATNMSRGARSVVLGAAVSGTLSTTQMSTDLVEATHNHYNGRTIIWTSGALAGQASQISAYNGTTKVLTFAAVTDVPGVGDQFVIA